MNVDGLQRECGMLGYSVLICENAGISVFQLDVKREE